MSFDINRAIPKIKVPSINSFSILDIDEPLVSVSKAGLAIHPFYYKEGVAGAYKDCYVRQSVLDMLLKAETLLPEGLHLKIWDGYRPICIQQRLWNCNRQRIKNENPKLTDKELDFKTSFFVSKPSYDVMKPSLHNTGGAVDLTLIDSNGKELNMGTKFDEFCDRSWSNHYEINNIDDEVRKNRRILYNVMIETGFTNLPSEWWHYDYGTKFWGYYKGGRQALYRGILDIDFPNRVPLI